MPLGLDINPEDLADICRRYHVVKLELFGSRARGDARPDSDVDLLVTFAEGKTPGFGFFALADELERALGRPVDLLTRHSIETDRNHVRRRCILRDTEALYAA